MITELPEELLEQAEILLTLPPNQANLRRAISTAYYAVFHLLTRAAVVNWSEPLHQARIARMFDHERMKKASGALLETLIGILPDFGGRIRSVAALDEDVGIGADVFDRESGDVAGLVDDDRLF